MPKRRKNKPTSSKNVIRQTIRKFFEKYPNKKIAHKEICAVLAIREGELRKQAFSVLKEMSEIGFIKELAHGVYQLNDSIETFEGEIQLNTRGAGFLITPKQDKDIYISPKHTFHALNGDIVKAIITKKGDEKIEGQVVEIVQRERTQFVGTIEIQKNIAFFIPDNQKTGTDIFIPKEKLKGAKNNDKVLVKITAWPNSSKNPYGEVIEVLGSESTNDIEMLGILCNYGIEIKFPQEVIEAAEKVGIELDEKEFKNRKDFREVTTFTIDPIDAKDFDDAISVKYLDNKRLEIGVHIADVSHYVQPESPMDVEALKRSNSVYLVDRVIPMLPEQLSNLACSLRPNEDKFSFSAVFEIDENGKVYSQWFGKTIIHSNRRFTYEEAQEIIEGKSGDFKKEIKTLDALAKILRKKRLNNGALNIESEEVRFLLDQDGNPTEVVIKTSKDAHKLVEEFMLLANRKVATFIAKPEKNKEIIPFVFRCHDKPDMSKIEVFKIFLDKFGHELNFTHSGEISKSINKLLADIRLTNEYSLIQSMAIRSMAKASYETENIGHYGLAFDYYTHFTSPIRRYADLVVHRILHEELTTKKHKYGNQLDAICKRISKMERKAVEAERESTKYFQTLFMKDHVGKTFSGTVSGISDFGMFVRMDENQCEGMIQLGEIPGDRFYFDQDKFRIIGAKTKKEFNFGDSIMVKITEVDVRKRQINLEIV
jgi:ribonuclease R